MYLLIFDGLTALLRHANCFVVVSVGVFFLLLLGIGQQCQIEIRWLKHGMICFLGDVFCCLFFFF